MDQVVRHVDAVQRLAYVVWIAGVCFDDLDVACPRHVAQRAPDRDMTRTAKPAVNSSGTRRPPM